MSTKSYRNISKKKTWKFKGISADAQTLGVTRCHLWYVLTGARPSPKLLAAYEALQKAKRSALKQVQANFGREARAQ